LGKERKGLADTGDLTTPATVLYNYLEINQQVDTSACTPSSMSVPTLNPRFLLFFSEEKVNPYNL
jgi:hypothetical protein